MDKMLQGLWVVYLCVGAVLFATSFKQDDATALMATTTGERCNASPAQIFVWPMYLKEFNWGGLRRGGLDLC